MDMFREMDRRDVVRFICVLGISVLMPNSSDPKEIGRLFENEDREGFYIRFIKPLRPIDPARWSMKVGGLCEKSGSFTLNAVRRLPKEVQASRMKCVESWSSKARWGGFRPKALFDVVKPLAAAKYLYFYSADDYYEYISLEELLKPRVIFAYEMNGGPLPGEYGGPLRLLMPSKYGYKSVKSIVRLEFLEKDGIGYWSKYGYSKDATIQPGTDHALDLKTYKRITKPGEPEY